MFSLELIIIGTEYYLMLTSLFLSKQSKDPIWVLTKEVVILTIVSKYLLTRRDLMGTTSQARRKETIAATLRLLAKEGIGQFTTAKLAQELGFSEALIFRHFASKDEILAASLEHLQQTLLTGIKKAITSSGSSQQKLAELLAFNLDLLSQNPLVPRLVFSDQLYLKNDALRKEFQHLYQTVHSLIKDVFVQGIQEGSLRHDLDPDLAVSTWIGFLHSLSLELTHATANKATGNPALSADEKARISRFLISLFVAQ